VNDPVKSTINTVKSKTNAVREKKNKDWVVDHCKRNGRKRCV
jgi:hypothetical protein